MCDHPAALWVPDRQFQAGLHIAEPPRRPPWALQRFDLRVHVRQSIKGNAVIEVVNVMVADIARQPVQPLGHVEH